MLALAASSGALGCTGQVDGDPLAEPMSAQQIQQHMQAAYASLPAYRDHGEVTKEMLQRDALRSTRSRAAFRTSFQRPAKLLLDYQDRAGRHVVWSDGQSPRSWSSWESAIVSHASLDAPLTAAAGVTSGVSALVPSMLIPGHSLALLRDPVLIGETNVEGEKCWELRGSLFETTITIAVSQSDFLLRRFQDRTLFNVQASGVPDELTAVDTIVFHPEIDPLLAPDAFRFDETARAELRAHGLQYEGIGAGLATTDHGVMFNRLFTGAPAIAAGLEVGDVIRAVNGEPTDEWPVEDIRQHLLGPAGSEVSVTIERAGAPHVIKIRRALIEL